MIKIDSIRKEKNGFYLSISVQDCPTTFLVDTGASVSIIKTNVFRKLSPEDQPELYPADASMETADGTPIPCLGKGMFKIIVNGIELEHELWVADINLDAILGFDFLDKYKCNLDFDKNELQIFEFPGNPYVEENESDEDTFPVALCSTTDVPPESEVLLKGRFVKKSGISMDGILEPSFSFLSSCNLVLAKTLVNSEQDNVIIRVINVTSDTVRVYEGTIVANLHRVEEMLPFV